MSIEKPKYVEYKNRADGASHNIAKAKHDTAPNDETWPEVGLHEYPHWKQTWQESFQIQDFFTEDEVEWFTDRMFRHHTDRRIKDSGTLHFFDNMGEIVDHFFDKFQSIMPELQKGDMSHTGNFVFSTTYILILAAGIIETTIRIQYLISKLLYLYGFHQWEA